MAAEHAKPHFASVVNGAELSALEVFQECDLCPEMMVMAPGSFLMAPREGVSWSSLWDDWGEQKRSVVFEGSGGVYNQQNEGPQRRVLMDTRYAMAVNEVIHAVWVL